MSYTVQTRNMGTIPSVRRRVFGPYKPCPRAKRVLMERQDTEQTVDTPEQDVSNNESNEDVDHGIEENIDFAVESSKVDNTPTVIELDTEDESEEANVDNEYTANDIDIRPVEELPNQSQSSVTDESVTDVSQDPSGSQLSTDIDLNREIPDQTENHASNEISLPPVDIGTDIASTPPRSANGHVKYDIKEAKAFKLTNEFSPKVIIERTPPKIFSTSKSNRIPRKKHYKTYMCHNHELRFFKIMLTDCCPTKKLCDEPTVKTYELREAPKRLQLSPNKSNLEKKDSAFNVIKQISCDVSKPEFIDNYESAIAKKLEDLKKKRLQNNPSRLLSSGKAHESSTPAVDQWIQTTESPKQPSFFQSKTDLSLTFQTDNSVPLTNIPETSTEVKQPIHPRTRLRLSPVKKPSRAVNMLNYAISKSQQKNYVEVSDSDTESQSSVVTTSEISEVKVEIKDEVEEESTISDDENISTVTADESETLDNMYIKPEIKNETVEGPSSYIIESDEEISACLLDAYKTVERRRRKVSSNKKIESVVTPVADQSKAKPTLIRLSPMKPSRNFPTTYTHQYSSSSMETSSIYDQSLPSNDFKPDIQINLVKLSKRIIENLITLCKTSTSWDDNSLLEKAGMSWYDIHRLGTVSRSRKISSYGLRQFVKKNKKLFEVNNIEKARPPSVLKGIKKADRKAMKLKLKMKERLEKKRQDEESIRRALLRINARVMNQNRFWAFINRGSSQDRPIIL